MIAANPPAAAFTCKRVRAIVVATLAALAASLAFGVEPSALASDDGARSSLSTREACVVSLEFVSSIQVSVGGRQQPRRENPREVNGTIVSPTGLTVVALSSIDPRASLPPQANIVVESVDFRELKLRLADGSQIPAHIVSRAEELDLAFVAPHLESGIADGSAASNQRRFAAVNLDDVAEPTVLGEYYELGRAPGAQSFAPIIRRIDVAGIVENPRRFIITSIAPASGTPIFDARGNLLGIGARFVAADGSPTQPLPGVVPAADVAATARAALAAIEEARRGTSAPAGQAAPPSPNNHPP